MKTLNQKKILVGVIVVLVVGIGILAWLNSRSLATDEPATLIVKENGEEVGSISLEEIKALGGEEFIVILRSSGKDPRENTYTGVALSRIVEAVKPGLITVQSQVTARAVDGYAVTYTGKELLQSEHIYLVWLKDGNPLGNKAKGGSGPMLVIPRQHEFGQFWCKFAVEVDVR